MDEYVRWREACVAVDVAYDIWSSAGREEWRLAATAYVAALDREEQAAVAYQRLVEDVVAA
jgi:hypothetical protein